ncbi:MAG: hypothetical protein ABDH18_01485 [Aquificaceae bacterium]
MEVLEASWQVFKRNIVFYVIYSVVYVLLLALTLLPVLGLFVSIFLSIYGFAGVLYISYTYFLENREDIQLEFASIKDYLVPSAGMYLGVLVLTLLSMSVFFLLILLFGGIGFLGDFMRGQKEGGLGLILAMTILVIFMLLVALYYLYSIPANIAKALADGLSFERSFLARFYPFTPSGVKDLMSGDYLKLGLLWSLIVSVLGLLGVILLILIITIPLAALIMCFIMTYTAMVGASFAPKLKQATT